MYKAKGLRPARAEEESVADNSTRTQDASLERTFDVRIYEASFLVFAVIFPQFVNVKTPWCLRGCLDMGGSDTLKFKWKNKVKKGRVTLK